MTVSRQREWQIANPEKNAAHAAARDALAAGRLVRPAQCSLCPNPEPQAHHEDYSKPLDVVWLCESCHRARHGELRAPVFDAATLRAMEQRPEIPPRDIIDSSDVRKMAGITQRHTLIRWRQDPTFPKAIKTTGGGTELFDRRAVRAWLKARGALDA